MMESKMLSPVTYQGGKGRIAKEIVSRMNVPPDVNFYDLCCGSGCISIALIEAGHDPKRIVMVDQGPWGAFWEAVGNGTFSLDTFASCCDSVPSDPREIKEFIEKLYQSPLDAQKIYHFLLLQAAAIGGKAVSWTQDRWSRGSDFRDYWLPTETSNRRSPVNPMMPMPATILSRMTEIVHRMCGVTGICKDASQVPVQGPAVVYIDPPYSDTTGYPYHIDAQKLARDVGFPCWISEGKALSNDAYLISFGEKKGGVTGNRKKMPHEEWLSYFSPTLSKVDSVNMLL